MRCASIGPRYASCIAVQSDDRNDSNHRLTSGIRHSRFRVATPAAIVAVYDCRARSLSLSFPLFYRAFSLVLCLLLAYTPAPSTVYTLPLLVLSSPLCPIVVVLLLVSLPGLLPRFALDPTRYRPHSRVQRRGRDICICIGVHRSLQPPRARPALASRYSHCDRGSTIPSTALSTSQTSSLFHSLKVVSRDRHKHLRLLLIAIPHARTRESCLSRVSRINIKIRIYISILDLFLVLFPFSIFSSLSIFFTSWEIN